MTTPRSRGRSFGKGGRRWITFLATVALSTILLSVILLAVTLLSVIVLSVVVLAVVVLSISPSWDWLIGSRDRRGIIWPWLLLVLSILGTVTV